MTLSIQKYPSICDNRVECVVLESSVNVGAWKSGYYSTDWCLPEYLTGYCGTVTLQNDP